MRVIVAFLLSLAVVAQAPTVAHAVDVQYRSLEHDGLRRSAIVEMPRDARDAPVLMVLHGALAGPSTVRRRARVQLARRGWIVVWPQAAGEWNDGRTDRGGEPYDTADDVGFLRHLIDRLAATGQADRERVFVAGPSIGGVMTLRLLCEAPDLVAGAAVAIASFPQRYRCPGGPPRPVLYIHGTEDDLMPPDGGRIGGWSPLVRDRGYVEPVADTVARIARRNGCAGVEESALPDRAADDGSTVRLRRYVGCAAPLIHYVVEGGGHTWPGSTPSRLGERIVGKTNQDFSATRAVEAFFQNLAGDGR
ncbi:MAG: hypothetical protein AAF677_14755 [Pseudomonadota bacterium]